MTVVIHHFLGSSTSDGIVVLVNAESIKHGLFGVDKLVNVGSIFEQSS